MYAMSLIPGAPLCFNVHSAPRHPFTQSVGFLDSLYLVWRTRFIPRGVALGYLLWSAVSLSGHYSTLII